MNHKRIILLLAAVQFVNIMDFMLPMPLGPFFAKGLGIDPSSLGFISGSYTAMAAVAGLIGALFLDQFDRRTVLLVALTGLMVATALGGLAYDMRSLIVTRCLAGFFGGPATSVTLAIVSDIIAPERRGRAMSTVMLGFTLATIFGVPASLKLATMAGWRLPFFAVAGLGVVVIGAMLVYLPKMRAHLVTGAPTAGLRHWLALFGNKHLLTYVAVALATFGAFAVIPNIAPYLLDNLHYPADKLWQLYSVGGIASFASLRLSGALIDRFGVAIFALVVSLILILSIYIGFVMVPPVLPLMLIFALFMIAMQLRFAAISVLLSRIPRPHERVSFMSMASSVQHFSSACGAFISSLILTTGVAGELHGMATVSYVAIAASFLVPLMMQAAVVFARRGEAKDAMRLAPAPAM